MSAKLNTLEDLYVEELQDLYSAETQITQALPKMIQAASSDELKKSFEQHLKQTEGQIQRLDQIFEKLGEDKEGKTCKAMKGLVAEGKETIDEDAEPSVKDAALIAAAQRIEHYEMAGYGTVRTYAEQLGYQDAVQLLNETFKEEEQTDKKLSKLAEQLINKQAATAG
jgi:ferritin-like metal-binding protein YciE